LTSGSCAVRQAGHQKSVNITIATGAIAGRMISQTYNSDIKGSKLPRHARKSVNDKNRDGEIFALKAKPNAALVARERIDAA
jgi:hypothetical protein